MGYRCWLIRMDGKGEALAVRRWLEDVEDKHRTHWGLALECTWLRRDGSIWAMVHSDGSGCVRLLADYGYSTGEVRLFGEFPEWDDARGHLGALAQAKTSAYLDPEPEEFVEADSAHLLAQLGTTVLVRVTGDDELADTLEGVRWMQREMAPRLVPRVDGLGGVFELANGKARLVGVRVERVSAEFARQLESKYAILSQSEWPENLRTGFSTVAGSKAKTALLNMGGEFEEFPLAGASLTPNELTKLRLRNVRTAFGAECKGELERLGFVRGGYLGGPDGEEFIFWLTPGPASNIDGEIEASFGWRAKSGGSDHRLWITLKAGKEDNEIQVQAEKPTEISQALRTLMTSATASA